MIFGMTSLEQLIRLQMCDIAAAPVSRRSWSLASRPLSVLSVSDMCHRRRLQLVVR